MRGKLILIGIVMAQPWSAGAQQADPATRDLIESLLKRIDSLEKRVAQLEHENTPAAVAAPVTTAPVAPPPAAGMVHAGHETLPETAQPAIPVAQDRRLQRYQFSSTNLHGASGGFRRADAAAAAQRISGGPVRAAYQLGALAKVSVFGELSFTARADAGTGVPAATGFNAEVERLIVRYDVNDYFKLSFGRYHTPINYWNTAFHHGQWLQTTISRPEMTQFGGSFIPVHFVGTLVEGEVPAGGLNLNYNVGLGNGRGQVISRGGDFGDVNNNRAWLVNAFVKPESPVRPARRRLGVSRHGESAERHRRRASGSVGAHRVAKETPEFIAEFANVTHQPVGGGPASNSQAFYVQTAYRLPWVQKTLEAVLPLRVHPRSAGRRDLPHVVPVFHASTAGVRYDITSFAAFKLEYRALQPPRSARRSTASSRRRVSPSRPTMRIPEFYKTRDSAGAGGVCAARCGGGRQAISRSWCGRTCRWTI